MFIERLALAIVVAASSALVSAQAPNPTGLNDVGQLVTVGGDLGQGFRFTRLQNGVQIRLRDVVKNIVFHGPDIVRVNANLGVSHAMHPSLAVVTAPKSPDVQVTETAEYLFIQGGSLLLKIDKQTAAIAFCRPDGNVLARERAGQPTDIVRRTVSDAPTYEIRQSFVLQNDEAVYGLGLCGEPAVNRRGQNVLMVQTNVGIVIPLLVSSKSYGILWDAYSTSTFNDGADGATFWSESSPAGIDYYFIGGDRIDGVIANYRNLTGVAPMLPKQAFGLFMSKERYPTQARLLDVARTFRKERFPMDYIVQDWQYWGSDKDGTWSGMIWNPERYPDPRAMTRELHDSLDMKLMASIWPSVGNDTDLAHELDAKGLRFEPLHWISKKARVYDAYSAEGRAIYFKHVKKGLLDVGVDALWMDGTEVEVGGACHNPAEVEKDIKGLGRNAMGDFTRYLNPYTLLTTQGTYEGQRATSDKRVFTLTRSAWAGAQRYSAVSWSGDTTASWQTLYDQIPGGLSVAFAGQPYWTQDTGGFFVNFPGGERNPEYRELFARWNQFAIFNPIYRIHGTNVEREPYLFKTLDPQVYESLLSAAHLRYRLLPYVYGLGWKSTNDGYTMMRGLAFDFPEDAKAREASDAFMFGPALLVHPVTRAMYHASDPPAETIPPQALRTPDGQPGLAGQYFEGTNFETPKGRVVDAKLDHTWPGPPLADPPAGLTSLDNFSGRWEGTILAPEDGEYEIGVEADDGMRLFLDGKLVAEDWRIDVPRYKGTKITLRQGQRVAVKVEYFQGPLGRLLRLAWRTPSRFRELQQAKSSLNSSVDTYLPAGTWYDFWTNQKMVGATTVTRDCPLDVVPIYVRAGAVIPMGPIVQYATEKPDAPYEIRIYPGADGSCTIYEDDNETYRYEKGERAAIDVRWNDASQTLTVGARQGAFPGMQPTRSLQIVLASPGQNVGLNPNPSIAKTIIYDGSAVVIALRV